MKSLAKRYFELPEVFGKAIDILESDPYNLSQVYDIKKLSNITDGLGEYRLRIGRWRFRYDIRGSEVIFYFCGLRNENTYG